MLSNQNEVLNKHIIIVEPFQSPYTKLLSKLQSIFFLSYSCDFLDYGSFLNAKNHIQVNIFKLSPYRQKYIFIYQIWSSK
jgi:hypothetical protein